MKRILLIYFILLIINSFIYSKTGNWEAYTDVMSTRCIAFEGDYAWIGTEGGLVKMNMETGEKIIYNTANSGLPYNQIFAIVIDKEGNKYLSTNYNIVVKFNNNQWTVYNTIEDSESKEYYNSMVIDKENTLWLTSWFRGIVKYENSNWKIQANISSLLSDYVRVSSICVDSNNTKWIAIYNGGLVRLNDSLFIYNKENSGLPSSELSSIFYDVNDSSLWMGTYDHRIISFKQNNWYNYICPIQSNWVLSVCRDNNGNIWGLSYYGQVLKFDGTDWKIYTYLDSELPSDTFYSISIDKEGNKWVAMRYQGLVKISDTSWKTYKTTNFDFGNYYINCIAFDSKGNSWIGTAGGLVKFNNSSTTFYNKANSFIPHNYVSALAIDSKDKKWVGTFRDGLAIFNDTTWTIFNTDNSPLLSNSIISLAIDSLNRVWVGTDKGLNVLDNGNWLCYNSSNSVLHNSDIYSLLIDNKMNCWVGTYYGLFLIDNNNICTKVDLGSNHEALWVHSLVEEDSTIWLGTSGGEPMIAIQEDINHSFSYYYKGGYYYTYSMVVDSLHNKWFSTGTELIKFNESYIKSFDCYNSCLKYKLILDLKIDPSGKLWIGTDQGLYIYNMQDEDEQDESDSINVDEGELPTTFDLSQNYPNPFNPSTTINYSIPKEGLVKIKVFDILGREVTQLVNSQMQAGNYKAEFNGVGLASGVYVYTLFVDNNLISSKKMLFLK